jgi:acetyl-CoA carboxylase alpha subunit
LPYNVDAIEIDEVQEEEAPSIDKIIQEEQTGMKRSRESSLSSVNESILKKVKASEKNKDNITVSAPGNGILTPMTSTFDKKDLLDCK